MRCDAVLTCFQSHPFPLGTISISFMMAPAGHVGLVLERLAIGLTSPAFVMGLFLFLTPHHRYLLFPLVA